MKQIVVIIAFISLASGFSFAQNSGSRQQLNYLEVTGYSGSRMALQKRFDNRYETIAGSPYLVDFWQPGRVFVPDDTTGIEFSMRYNVLGQEMEFVNRMDTLVISYPEKIDKIILDDHLFQYQNYMDDGNQLSAFFEILLQGRTKLLVRYHCRLERGTTEITPYSGEGKKDRFVQEKIYYYQTIDMDMPDILPVSRKTFLLLPVFNGTEIQDLLKLNKTNPRREDDLVVLFTAINNISTVK
jgi:hypothetical protein